MAEKKSDDIRCKKCDSLETYIRIKTFERICRKCGAVEKIKEETNG